MAAKGLGPQLKAFINSPTGPRTTHFWWVTRARRPGVQCCVSVSGDAAVSVIHLALLISDQTPCAIALQGTSSKLGCVPGCSLHD